MRRTRINWKIFQADTFLEESARRFGRRELDYRQWAKLVRNNVHWINALTEIQRIKIAVPLKDAQHCAHLWAVRRFGKG